MSCTAVILKQTSISVTLLLFIYFMFYILLMFKVIIINTILSINAYCFNSSRNEVETTEGE